MPGLKTTLTASIGRRVTEARYKVGTGAGSRQSSPCRRIGSPKVEDEVGCRARDILHMNSHQSAIDVVIDYTWFPNYFHDMRSGRRIKADGAGLLVTRAHPVRHPEGIRHVAFLLDINFRRALAIIEKTGAYLAADLHRNVLCPLESTVEEAIQRSRLPPTMLPEAVSVNVSPIPALRGETCEGGNEPGPGALPLSAVHWYPTLTTPLKNPSAHNRFTAFRIELA